MDHKTALKMMKEHLERHVHQVAYFEQKIREAEARIDHIKAMPASKCAAKLLGGGEIPGKVHKAQMLGHAKTRLSEASEGLSKASEQAAAFRLVVEMLESRERVHGAALKALEGR